MQNKTYQTIPGRATCDRRHDRGGSARDPRQQTRNGPGLGAWGAKSWSRSWNDGGI